MIELAQCTCTFRGPGEPMNTVGCPTHGRKAAYPCVSTKCWDYRPISEPKIRLDGGRNWPRCVCSEIAQEHN